MIRLFNLEVNKLKITLLLAFLISVISGIICVVPYIDGYMYYSNLSIWVNASDLTGILYPLFATLPVCWLMYYERKDNFLLYTSIRTSKKKYIISKCATAIFFGGLYVFIVSFVSLCYSLYLINLPVGGTEALTSFMQWADTKMFSNYIINKPFLYGVYISLWRFFIGSLYALLGFILSIYMKNIFVILSLPYAYSIVENFTFSILKIPQYSIITSYYPSRFGKDVLSAGTLLAGPLIMIAVILGLIIYFSKIKKIKIYEG